MTAPTTQLSGMSPEVAPQQLIDQQFAGMLEQNGMANEYMSMGGELDPSTSLELGHLALADLEFHDEGNGVVSGQFTEQAMANIITNPMAAFQQHELLQQQARDYHKDSEEKDNDD